MKHISIAQKVANVLYAAVFVFGLFVFTGITEAALPEPYAVNPTPTCVSPKIQNFTPYIYDGELHSFEYTVSGSENPLVVATVVGERGIEYRYTTQRRGEGLSRVHVDVPGWYGFSGDTRIVASVATGADAHCWSVAEFRVKLSGPTKSAATVTAITPVATPTVKPRTETPPSPKGVRILDNTTSAGTPPAPTAPKDSEEPISSDASLTREMITSISAFFGAGASKNQCRDLPQSAWIALLIAIIVALLVVIDRLPYLLKGNGVQFAISHLIVFVVALTLWFIFDGCRSHRWFPIAVTVLVLLTLLTPTALDVKRVRVKK